MTTSHCNRKNVDRYNQAKTIDFDRNESDEEFTRDTTINIFSVKNLNNNAK